ncbi:hypothetical protein EB796_016728 [Bugula neritina]|uniref:Uncharacterized protein n=1 Tax=Bugula neritina TaxID=10212 RepID=A0A7J7JHW2_BUGNE|nr:hypothetical protein EB796_016728 [Bugula neritina]
MTCYDCKQCRKIDVQEGGGIKAETFKIFVAGSDLSDGLSPPDLAVVRVLGSSSNSSSKKQELSADQKIQIISQRQIQSVSLKFVKKRICPRVPQQMKYLLL